jgi:hypothetical protein
MKVRCGPDLDQGGPSEDSFLLSATFGQRCPDCAVDTSAVQGTPRASRPLHCSALKSALCLALLPAAAAGPSREACWPRHLTAFLSRKFLNMSQASKPPVLDERPAADNHVLPPSPGKDRQAGVLSRRSLLKASAAVGGLGLGLLGVPATSAAQLSADSSAAVRPFRVAFAKEALDDLRRRIAATRWPSRETVADESQGVRLATMQQLARYWMTDYDWRKAEAKLNALPQFVTTIDGGGHPFDSRAFQACQRAAAHRHARLARLGHRAPRVRRAAYEPDSARRKRR